ncbi:MAG TPA: SH3 domain-containing protein, partial [Solirubrobacteraceae bacterium]|nr:SH3 domain-containing protein [Solirubrobacteraceae bacterium]
RGTAVVRRTLRLTAGELPPRQVALRCPPGLRVADLVPARGGARLAATYAPSTTVGVSTTAQVAVEQRRAPRDATFQVAILCKRPGDAGSLVPGGTDARAAGVEQARTVSKETYLLTEPGGDALGSVRAGQPVRVLAARGAWRRVETNAGARGWIPADALR